MFDTVLFDLDGTLTDSGPGITNAVAYALEQLGRPAMTQAERDRFVGPPLHDSFRIFCGMTEEESLEAVRLFRVYYNDRGVYENSVYPGIEDMLEALTAQGKKLAVATSKPEHMAKKVIAHFGLDRWLTQIAGASLDTSRNKKDQVIAHALREFGIDRERAVMVGDREHDVIGAAAFGIPTVGVTWGYGSREELEQSGARFVIDEPEALAEYLR